MGGTLWVALAEPILAIPARHPHPQHHCRPPAPGPAGSLGAIRWQRPISSLFGEVFSDGKGEKGICEPCKPIPLSWVNNGSSVGSRMLGCRSREMGLKCSLSRALSWGAAGGAPNPLQSPPHFLLGVQNAGSDGVTGGYRWELLKNQGLSQGLCQRYPTAGRGGRTQAKQENRVSLARESPGMIPHSSTAPFHASTSPACGHTWVSQHVPSNPADASVLQISHLEP